MAPTLDIEKLQPGDLIEISRGRYQHWAVYTGDGYVVHVAPPCEGPGAGSSSVMSVVADRAVVKREFLWNVVGDDDWRVNNDLDNEYHPRPGSIIVNEAMQWVGKVVPYSVFSRNCEHFVNNLRYGKHESRQVNQAKRIALAAGGTVAVFGGILGFLALMRGNRTSDRNTE
ncbi:phospholipase A and acyltransferase 4-like [Paralichthys olivaceus]|uniref:phospholipase A and acyltransferase 4-like n=1 Tax=Paralichthys olivaceus TaxID=8255 RepID=UPI0037527351